MTPAGLARRADRDQGTFGAGVMLDGTSRYALRGVGHAEELFTIDPALIQPG